MFHTATENTLTSQGSVVEHGANDMITPNAIPNIEAPDDLTGSFPTPVWISKRPVVGITYVN